MNKFDSVVTGALDIAQTEALKRKNSELTPEHVLLGLISNPVSFASRELKNYKKEIENRLNQLNTILDIRIDQIRPSSELSEWLTLASSHAIQNGRQEVSEKDLLRHLPQALPDMPIDFNLMQSTAEDEDNTVPEFIIDLNKMAEEGKLDPVIGRTKEIRAVMEILGRRGKNNPVLVGPSGVGKTAIVEGLAEAIVKGAVPDLLKGKTVYSLDMGSLMAGTKFRGEFEERLQKLIKFAKKQAGEAILFIDEIHQLVGAGKTDGAMDAANLLKPALARGELNCVGATTPEEYQKYILGDSALDRRFRGVLVNEPSKEDAIEIMMGIREKLEIHHGIKISDDAIYNAVFLSDQYITDKNLPDKAIDLVDEASSALKLSAEAMPTKLAELESEIRSKNIYAQVHKDNKDILREIEQMEKEFTAGKEKWEKEVQSMRKVTKLKNQLDRYKFELEQAERTQDYETASKLMYSIIPEVQNKLEENSHNWVLSSQDVASVISRQTEIPIEKIMKSKQENILEIESYLKSRVHGQDRSLNEIADTLITSHAGLKDETRPLGSFLLRGHQELEKQKRQKLFLISCLIQKQALLGLI